MLKDTPGWGSPMVPLLMPILKPTAKIFRDVPASVDMRLPDIAQLGQEAGGAPISDLFEAFHAQQSAKMYQVGSQAALAGISQNVGIPSQAGTFNTIKEAFRLDALLVVDDVLQSVGGVGGVLAALEKMQAQQGGEPLLQAVQQGVGIAVRVATAGNPIGRWIERAIWSVVRFLRRVNNRARVSAEAAKLEFPQTTFNPELDNWVLNSVVLQEIRQSKDWSRMFGPPGGKLPADAKPFRFRHLQGGGLRIYPGESWAQDGFLGMVPGTAFLHQGVELVPQARDMGETLLPSPRNILTWLWKAVAGKGTNVTPALYCVDTDVIELWGYYIFQLHKYVHESDEINEDRKQRIIDDWNRRIDPATGKTAKIFGWGTSIKPKSNEEDDYAPMAFARKLRKRQMAYLDTIMVAYLSSEYIALRKDAALRSRWQERREQLLNHPAVCDVDLRNVPDGSYKEAVKSKQRSMAGPCKAPTMSKTARVPEDPDAPDAQGGGAGADAGDNGAGKTAKKGIGWLPVLAAGGLGLWWATRK